MGVCTFTDLHRFTGVGSRPSCRCPVSNHCGVLCGQMNWPSRSPRSPLHCNLSLYLIVKHIGNGRIHTSVLKSGRRTCGRMLFWPGAIYLSQWCLIWCGCAWAVAQWAWQRSPSSWEGCSRFERCPEDRRTGRTRWPWKPSVKATRCGNEPSGFREKWVCVFAPLTSSNVSPSPPTSPAAFDRIKQLFLIIDLMSTRPGSSWEADRKGHIDPDPYDGGSTSQLTGAELLPVLKSSQSSSAWERTKDGVSWEGSLACLQSRSLCNMTWSSYSETNSCIIITIE